MQRALNVIYITESEYDVSFSLLLVAVPRQSRQQHDYSFS
jgi:hypothetical protein